jgi:LEA14-like dessication related protein
MRKSVVTALAAVTLGGAGCASLGLGNWLEPVVTLRNVRVNGLGLTGGSLEVQLSVYNPNRVPLDATELSYNVWVDSVKFGEGKTDRRFTVGKGDSTVVSVPLDFSWSGLNSAARSLLNTGTVNYRVAGDIKVGSALGNFTVRYDQTGRYSTLGGTNR